MSISVASAPGLRLWIIDTFSFEVLFITMSLLTLTSLAFAMTIKYPQQTPPPIKTKLVFFEKLALRPSIVILLVFMSFVNNVMVDDYATRDIIFMVFGIYWGYFRSGIWFIAARYAGPQYQQRP